MCFLMRICFCLSFAGISLGSNQMAMSMEELSSELCWLLI
jgi:hypothetical protein